MKIAAILLCAGDGSRFGSSLPKQFHFLGEKKLYRHPLDTLIESQLFSEIRIVGQKKHLPYFDPHPSCVFVEGGNCRQDSVRLGLFNLKGDFVIICEGVRPFLTLQLLQDHIKKLSLGSVAVNTCIPCTDTINIHKDGLIKDIPDRKQFFRGQTPQSFSIPLLQKGHEINTKEATDDCSLLLELGFPVDYVFGSEKNLKITTPYDLEVATHFFSFPCK
jgi:2-C-methyl-D-erythritol 4-phosphate cytidylyltransferase